ncbi:hypothetical protein [Mycolicibacterium sp.]|uniref:hypothetical protein n=1 Tax=Mycolicibacterium sp. TaxID=2320850 RepID=UPI003D10E006
MERKKVIGMTAGLVLVAAPLTAAFSVGSLQLDPAQGGKSITSNHVFVAGSNPSP